MLANFRTVLADENLKTAFNDALSSLISMALQDGTASTSLSLNGDQSLPRIEILNPQVRFNKDIPAQGLRRAGIEMDGNTYVNLINLLRSHA